MNKRHDEHYIRSVTEMGDVHRVVTNQAIFTSKGIKLVEKGVSVNSAIFNRLVKNKLTKQIDQCLSMDGEITQDSLRDYARDLLDNDPGLLVFRAMPDYRDSVLRTFYAIPLLPSMAFKLTVARFQRPEIFDHCIRVALISLYLAIKSRIFSEQELAALATAAVFHDIGILHILPELMKPGRRMSKSERQHLYAHPIAGFLILREYPEYHPDVSRPVFEHHERLDGSGYPRGLKGDEICLGAQVIMLAEVANVFFEKNAKSHNAAQLSVMLKLNSRKFNRVLSNHLMSLVREMKVDQSPPQNESVIAGMLVPRLVELSQVFQDWDATNERCKDEIGAQDNASLLAVVNERVTDLQTTLVDAGFDMESPAVVVEIISDDPEAMRELQMLVRETSWQLAEIVHEVRRRWQEISGVVGAVQSLVLEWLERSERVLKLG